MKRNDIQVLLAFFNVLYPLENIFSATKFLFLSIVTENWPGLTIFTSQVILRNLLCKKFLGKVCDYEPEYKDQLI